MEALSTPKGGGEARRIHIIYFLSRMGHVEHPHLIRIHHLNRQGVYLRDVKRWLADLRGKDMPEAFTWSYKRRYQSGYVWQDLLDGDLITPISDNEYVLKGSEIFSTAGCDVSPDDYILFKDEEHVDVGLELVDRDNKQPSSTEDENNLSIDQGSPISGSDNSTLTDVSMRQRDIAEHPNPGNINSIIRHPEQQALTSMATATATEELENRSSPYFNANQLGKKESKERLKNQSKKRMGGLIMSFSSPTSSPSASPSAKSRSGNTSKPSQVLRNLITCGAADANDVVLVAHNSNGGNGSNNSKFSSTNRPTFNKMDGVVFGIPSNQQQQSRSQNQWAISKSFGGVKESTKKQQVQSGIGCSTDISAAYKPQGTPACSQCGKPFKPEKLHAHMKSCRGMKAFARNVAASSEEISAYNCRDSSPAGSAACGYFLTN